MKYKNNKTGIIISTLCKIAGGDWVPHEEVSSEAVKNTEMVEETKKEETPVQEVEPTEEVDEVVNDEAIDSITKKQIMQELDAMGIKYDKKDKKIVLYNLMIGE